MITIKKTGRTWSVMRGQTVLAGGFFAKEAAAAIAKDIEDHEKATHPPGEKP